MDATVTRCYQVHTGGDERLVTENEWSVSVNSISARVGEPKACIEQLIIEHFNWSSFTPSVPFLRHMQMSLDVSPQGATYDQTCEWKNETD